MSIRIVTVEEAKKMKELCDKYDEYCEYIIGKAKIPYVCDNTNEEIKQGAECAVVLVLPSKKHFN